MQKMLEYHAVNKEVFKLVPTKATRILDIGCGNGALGASLKKISGAEITGITFSPQEYEKAQELLDKVVQANLNFFDFLQLGAKFDCIIASHILEHLYEPWDVVKKLEEILLPGGTLIIALPNILYYKQRFQFLKGQFTYSLSGGPMDITHYRFFDWESCLMLFKQSNLQLIEKKATGNFPLPLIRRMAPALAKKFDGFWVRCFPGFFGFQILMTAVKK